MESGQQINAATRPEYKIDMKSEVGREGSQTSVYRLPDLVSRGSVIVPSCGCFSRRTNQRFLLPDLDVSKQIPVYITGISIPDLYALAYVSEWEPNGYKIYLGHVLRVGPAPYRRCAMSHTGRLRPTCGRSTAEDRDVPFSCNKQQS